MVDTREKLIDIITDYADFLDWERVDGIADTIMEKCFATDNDVGGKWISVEDRLPEEKVNCIAHYKHAYCGNDDYWAIGIRFYDGKKFQMDWAYKVTHWMPLPEPPTCGADMRGNADAAD